MANPPADQVVIKQKVAVPKDGNSVSLPLTPSALALAVTNNGSLSSSATITFNAASTFIEVNALSQGVFMKWGATATSSSFDEYIQAGATRHYIIPVNQTTGTTYTTAQFIQQAASATIIVIEK